MSDSSNSVHELVFAIGHEVGNHLGGIRLQAHLLDDELDAREMASASVTIDDLAGRSGPLLSLLRPLLSDKSPRGAAKSWEQALAGIEREIHDNGTRGVELDFHWSSAGASDPAAGSRLGDVGFEWTHALLIALLDATVVHAGRGGRVQVLAERVEASAGSGVILWIEDDGPEEELGENASLRGRPLAVALAAALLGRVGGATKVLREKDLTRVGLTFPGTNKADN